ncbi:E3 ubiquitin-protein ligase RING1-like [Quillaja saponaria]|uniref:RING-type E3 ubiquitin transferase n=1 Tax=Quillaja saponaria TaxID=32244 RepID=A0AAD7L2A9_QUISA|nr:E3 ubiquitin-protein ligase RING1-like [Quillaja saponaria]
MASVGSSFWCYRCNRFIRARVRAQDTVLCPDCGAGFIEEISTPTRSPVQRFPAAALYVDNGSNSEHSISPTLQRSRRNGGDRSPFNPVIVLRGPADGGSGNEGIIAERGNFELYYDEGAGSGLRPLPSSVSEFLMGSGFDRLLDQLAQLEINGVGRLGHPPASKAAIDSMPIIKIVATHISIESHCAVCKEPFELDSEAREMPCKHIYHFDCILPWLSIRNSCPVCRHELPTEVSGRNSPVSDGVRDGDTVGLTIWRLPGGGFAVGRFTGGRRAAERELPVVYTEMDGGFNAGGVPRRISWETSVRRSREARGLGGVLHNVFSFFRRLRTSSSRSSGAESRLTGRSRSNSVFNRISRRGNQLWSVDDNRWLPIPLEDK